MQTLLFTYKPPDVTLGRRSVLHLRRSGSVILRCFLGAAPRRLHSLAWCCQTWQKQWHMTILKGHPSDLVLHFLYNVRGLIRDRLDKECSKVAASFTAASSVVFSANKTAAVRHQELMMLHLWSCEHRKPDTGANFNDILAPWIIHLFTSSEISVKRNISCKVWLSGLSQHKSCWRY